MRPSKSWYVIFPPKDRRQLPKEHDYWLFCLFRTNRYSVNSAVGSRIDAILFRSFQNQNRSQKNTITVYSVYSHSGIVPKEHALRSYFVAHSISFTTFPDTPCTIPSMTPSSTSRDLSTHNLSLIWQWHRSGVVLPSYWLRARSCQSIVQIMPLRWEKVQQRSNTTLARTPASKEYLLVRGTRLLILTLYDRPCCSSQC